MSLRTTHIRDGENEYGTPVSVFLCTECGGEFTICPRPPVEEHWMWAGCGDYECASYDVSRDVLAIVGFGWGTLHAGGGTESTDSSLDKS